MSGVPEIRISPANTAPVRGDGGYVLYWMVAARRTTWNFALDRALEWSRRLRKPLIVFEALRRGFAWESERIRNFVLEGMRDNALALKATHALYYPYIEPAVNEGRGLLAALAARAAVIVTDEFPCFFLPRMVEAAAARVPVLMEQVDSNGLMPLRTADKEFSTAFAFRRFLQVHLPGHLASFPKSNPLSRAEFPRLDTLPSGIAERWPPTDLSSEKVKVLPDEDNEDRGVSSIRLRGGSLAAKKRLRGFLRHKLRLYAELRNEPSKDVTSGLSPYLHFGHISVHEVFSRIARKESWNLDRIASRATGKRTGWWCMSAPAEAFLDQIVTWRELGFQFCHRRKDYDRFKSLPDWAQATLGKHRRDRRPYVYDLDSFQSARTQDPLWNAAQTQLLTEGKIHNYLRMLWGKKILEWTRSPKDALEIMIELNNRYALDGRDPNSYSGIFWCLGRFDRPWGPERPIFGTVRYMSSANTARKLHVEEYLRRYGQGETSE